MFRKAIRIARDAHAGQFRKYTNEPYIVHPFAVAGLVSSVSDDIEMYIAAILHDVVEDTDVSIGRIKSLFGNRVMRMVSDLTDISILSQGNRKVRKEIDLNHTANASPEAKTIKLADLIDNTKSITSYDKNFAVVYMKEKKKLMEVLKEGDKNLYKLAKSMIQKYDESKLDEWFDKKEIKTKVIFENKRR